MIDFKLRPGLAMGLSVALFALTSGIAQAEDPATGDEDVLVLVEDGSDDGVIPDEVTDDDMIAWSGEIIEDDGAVPGDDGDVEYIVDETVIDPLPGDGYLEDDPIFVDSECGGCEYTTTDLGGRPVMENARGDVGLTPAVQGWDSGSDVDPFARGNICFASDTYVGFLCDWQRPFLGDLMPAP
jgi:hypothetical protein